MGRGGAGQVWPGFLQLSAGEKQEEKKTNKKVSDSDKSNN